MEKPKLHPAVAELRRFLQLKGDTELTDFMGNWLNAWVDLFVGGVDVKTSAKLMWKGTEAEYKNEVLAQGYKALGIAVGMQCAEMSDEPTADGTRYTFGALALRTKKKSVIAQAP